MSTCFRSGLSVLCLVLIGCGQSSGSNPTPDAGGSGSGGSAVTGSGGTTSSGSGGNQEATGGSGGMAVPGSGGTVAVVDAMPEAGGSGGAPAPDAAPAGNFTCTLILGAGQTLQWYNGGGFQAAVGDAKWEIKATDNTFAETWANAGSGNWSLATASPCATNPTMPDRVILIVYSHSLTAAAEWETQIGMVMTNIKTKYPSAKAIELLSFARGPGNMMCGSSPYTMTTAAQDQAMQAVADKSGGMVKVGPKYFVPSCASFATANNTNLNAAGATAVADMLSAVYK